MTVSLTPQQVLTGIGVLLALFFVWRVGAKRARAAADAARTGARLVSLAGRVTFTAALMVGVQWLVITHSGNVTLLLVVLVLPDLLAGYVLTKALTVSTMDDRRRSRGDRR
ncbi:hypothetical protein ALI144C_33870 [Actinosynnema sp. ALI-1.44]|uniref:hypothetical protein n=1 Tax=Actinosynnema sp. ALI-1.44 TaxID=1933779 RepID=UPI00097BEB66|nr:hypothetical protein [Actinosynnema sp. ALI-1.44]ONI77084.1 hypothetical protein ALI144C_33870 [Actinosynnema sp. ALI-1.44]